MILRNYTGNIILVIETQVQFTVLNEKNQSINSENKRK